MRATDFIKRYCVNCEDFDDRYGCRAYDGEECDEVYGQPRWRGLKMSDRVTMLCDKRHKEEGAKDMKRNRKTTSSIAAIADLIDVPRRKFAKDIEALQKPKRTIWVMKEPKSGCYLFYAYDFSFCFLGDIDTLLFGTNRLLFADTRKELEEDCDIKHFAKESGFKLKPVRITVEIKECKGVR